MVEFIEADFTALELAPGSLDAVVSLYAFNHVPRGACAPTCARTDTAAPAGLFMTALGVSDTEAGTGDWLGASMLSSFRPEMNRQIVLEAGFKILRDELVTFREPEGDVTLPVGAGDADNPYASAELCVRRVLHAGEWPVRFEPPTYGVPRGVSRCAWSRTHERAQASLSLSRSG